MADIRSCRNLPYPDATLYLRAIARDIEAALEAADTPADVRVRITDLLPQHSEDAFRVEAFYDGCNSPLGWNVIDEVMRDHGVVFDGRNCDTCRDPDRGGGEYAWYV